MTMSSWGVFSAKPKKEGRPAAYIGEFDRNHRKNLFVFLCRRAHTISWRYALAMSPTRNAESGTTSSDWYGIRVVTPRPRSKPQAKIPG